ncbi:MAG: sodium:proton antiporter [Desulfovibrionaceae bacterium]
MPFCAIAAPAIGALDAAPHLDGSTMHLIWALPFICMLLSIAVFPLVAPNFWHHHFGKVSIAWAVLFFIPFTIHYGYEISIYELLHVLFLEYIPFIVLLFSLYTVAGGIRIKGRFVGSPIVNTTILLLGTSIASFMGTTGAAVLLIRPLLNANISRKYKVHTVVFFIFLVANIGGSLTPLGDPPLFLGFLNGVSFFWTMEHMFLPMFFVSLLLLFIYFILDSILYKKEGSPKPSTVETPEAFGIEGGINFLLLLGIIIMVLISGFWKAPYILEIYHIPLAFQNILRELVLIGIAILSLKLTSIESRQANGFNWFPIQEVAKIFIGIFITMIAPIAILKAGTDGALQNLIALVSTNKGEPVNFMYFWLTGLLSSFLDNAPTYLVFFNTAGGDPAMLMTVFEKTLLAISLGAVFMGANSYIGNAPNFMIRSIAEDQGVKMPSFFGYLIWSFGILIPIFILLSLILF